MRRSLGAAAALILLISVPVVSFSSGDQEAALSRRISQLEQRIAALEERIRVLEEKIARLSGAMEMPQEVPSNFEAGWRKLAIGMTREQVRRLLGEPDEVSYLSYLEIWDYSARCKASCSVTFDEQGRVESWKSP